MRRKTMLIPYNWLKQYVDFRLSPEELAERLTNLGLEVEEITEVDVDGHGETVLKAEITPNRGDCLSLVGVARETAAALGREVKYPPLEVVEGGGEITPEVSVTIEVPHLCPRYSARLIRGVTIGESPAWLKERLRCSGAVEPGRPINNVVDITNYVMQELGQPLHAFDFDTLRGRRILVRTARPGEFILPLEGELRWLSPSHLVIADAEVPIAIAGVMGGEETAVHPGTTNVLLESAHFNPASVRYTARELGLNTEASYRFSRYVDPSGTVAALDRAAQLIVELAGGEVVPGVVDVYPRPIRPRVIRLRPQRCNEFLGLTLSVEEIAALLRRLSLTVTLEGEVLVVTVPTFRGDLSREADLIEEVARLYGYNNIPATLPSGASAVGGLSEEQKFERRVRDLLLACGLNEVVTFSLTNPKSLARAGELWAEDEPIAMKNALSEEYSVLRPVLLPSILEVVAHNWARRETNVQIFELGRVYRDLQREMTNEDAVEASRLIRGRTASTLPLPVREQRTLAGALVGTHWSSAWNLDGGALRADFYRVKGILECLLQELGIGEYTIEATQHPAFHPGRCARLVVAGEECGVFGEIRAEVAAAYEVKERIYAFEVNLEPLLARTGLKRHYQPIPRYPAATRDLAVVVANEVPAAQIEAIIRRESGALLERAEVFDVYTGPPVPSGHRSVAYALTFRSPERTLTDEEVEALMQRIIAALAEELDARLRE